MSEIEAIRVGFERKADSPKLLKIRETRGGNGIVGRAYPASRWVRYQAALGPDTNCEKPEAMITEDVWCCVLGIP